MKILQFLTKILSHRVNFTLMMDKHFYLQEVELINMRYRLNTDIKYYLISDMFYCILCSFIMFFTSCRDIFIMCLYQGGEI